jgi:UDP-glucose 4-epimerase
VPYDVAYTRGFEDMQRRVPDLGKLTRLLGERPRTSLQEILAAVIGDIRRRRHLVEAALGEVRSPTPA